MNLRILFTLLVCAAAMTPAGLVMAADDPEVFQTPTTKAVPTRMPAPEYSNDLRSQRIEGIVILVAIVDEKGAVVDVKVQKTAHEQLSVVAEQAVRRWKFKPAQKDGIPIRCKFTVPLKFTADE
jgi:TonB family protein